MNSKLMVNLRAHFLKSFSQASEISQWVAEHPQAKFSFIGRSNAGKSSLLNLLCQKKDLARVSNTPGRTQLINLFEIEIEEQVGYFLDLPGFGHAKVSKAMKNQWNEFLTGYFEVLPPESPIIWIQDGRHPWQKVDFEMAQFLKQFGFIHVLLVFTKVDKLKTQKERAALKVAEDQSFKNFPIKKIFKTSIRRAESVDELKEEISHWTMHFSSRP